MLLSPTQPPAIVSDTSEWNLASRALLSKYNRAIDAFQRAVKPLIDEVKLDTSDPLFTGDTPAAFLFMLNDKVGGRRPLQPPLSDAHPAAGRHRPWS